MLKPISSIIAICLLAFTILAQRSERPLFFCSYGEENRGAELCARIQMESFASNAHAERAIDKIVKPLGLRRNFVMVSCPNINNARAVTYDDGVRYIVYDNAFMERIDSGANTDWASLSILAHEVGHHLQGHTLRRVSLQQRRMNELEADEFSGFVMFKLGARLSQAQAAMNNLREVDDEENSTHPKKWRRLEAIKAGYDNAKSQQPLENLDTRPSAEAYFSKASALHDQKQYGAALENYTMAIGLNPNFSYAYNNRGIVKSDLQDIQGAIKDYNIAMRIDPSFAMPYANRASAKIALRDYRGAVEDASQAIRLDPSFVIAYVNRANAKTYLQDYRGVIEDSNQAIRLDPSFAKSYFNRGVARYNLGMYREALKDYDKAIHLGANFPNAYRMRGVVKFNLQDFQGAIEDYSRAIRLDANYADAFYSRGSTKYELKDYRGAIEDCSQAIRLDPSNSEAYKIRAAAKAYLGDRIGACEDFRTACNMRNNDACRNVAPICN